MSLVIEAGGGDRVGSSKEWLGELGSSWAAEASACVAARGEEDDEDVSPSVVSDMCEYEEAFASDCCDEAEVMLLGRAEDIATGEKGFVGSCLGVMSVSDNLSTTAVASNVQV